MLGFFEWISDELNPPEDAYDPAIARPRCRICGKDAWLMWNGKYSAYCSTDCRRNDRRRGPGARSEESLLPSRVPVEPSSANVFERTIAAKRAAKDIKAIAKKWTAQKREKVKEEAFADAEQQRRGSPDDHENIQKRLLFEQREAEEAEFCRRQTRLAQVAEELAKEQLRCQAEKSPPCVQPPSPDTPISVIHQRCLSFLETEAAALEQAFVDELRRQADVERRQVERDTGRKAVAESTDIPQASRVRRGDSPVPLCRHEDKAVQAHMPADEENRTELIDARSSNRRRRRTEEDKVSTDSRQVLDEKALEHQETAPEVTTSEVSKKEPTRPLEPQQSTRPPNAQISGSGTKHMAAKEHWRGSTASTSGTLGRKIPLAKSTYTEATRQDHKDDHQMLANIAQFRQDERRLQKAMKNGASRSRDSTSASHRALHAQEATHEGHILRKFRQSEKRKIAIKPTKKWADAVMEGKGASTTLQQDSPGTLLVAGTTEKFITLDDLHQLRNAAWKETNVAMEEQCAWCEHSPYAGTLEVHLQCAESLNPARVSPGDKIYLVVRCAVAEKEWTEKRSKSVSNLTWEERMKFPVSFAEYPRGPSMCVQLWKQAPQRGDEDHFIGEGEIPFPFSTTRCALRVQLCWNPNLGGYTADLDCGRLCLAVQLVIDSSNAQSGPLQVEALSRNTQEDGEARKSNATLLQTRTVSNGTQRRMSLCRHISVHSNATGVAEGVQLSKDVLHSESQPIGGEGICKTVKRGTDVERAGDAKRKFTRCKSYQTHPPLTLKKGGILSCNAVSKGTDEHDEEERTEELTVKAGMQESKGKRHETEQQRVRTAAEEKLESSTTGDEVTSVHKKAPEQSDTKPATQEGKQGSSSHSTHPSSADASPVRPLVHPTSKPCAEVAMPTLHTTSKVIAPSTACTQMNSVKLDSGGVNVQVCVSNSAASLKEKPHSLVSELDSQGTAIERFIPPSAVPRGRISEAELQALLPVALAQMDDFTPQGGEADCLPPAATLDAGALIQSWRTGQVKRVRCANRLCRRLISNKYMSDLFEEEEFRAWGCCSICQAEMFRTKISSHTEDVIEISKAPGRYDEFKLDSFIPIAFPSLCVIWPSSRHLYVAQRFTHVQIQDRLRRCKMQRQLSLLLMAPLLKYFIRPDWDTYRQLALRTCVHLKIRQHPRLQLLLASTGQSTLYDSELPDFWEWESDEEATHGNLVGKLLMELRKEYL